MFEQILRVISKICGVSGGLALIGLAIMWFGVVPMVGCIFGSVSYWMLLCTSILMIIVIVLIIKFVMTR